MEKNKLEVTTKGDREIIMTRVFNAPRNLVFDAWTKPELLRRWLGVFEGHEFETCEVDLRVGGKYRYVWRLKDGSLMGMGGVFQEIVPGERLVSTEKFDEEWYPGEALNTLLLTEENGVTTCTTIVVAPSKEARDGMLQSGMTHGVGLSYDALDEVLTLAAR